MKTPPSPHFVPTKIISVDLASGLIEIPVVTERALAEYSRVHSLVRLGQTPVGMISLEDVEGVDEETLTGLVRAQAWFEFETIIVKAFVDAGLRVPDHWGDLEHWVASDIPTTGPLVSICVSALHNDEAALACVERITRSNYKNIEVLLVDNSDNAEPLAGKVAKRFAEDKRVRHVLEPRRGLSRARNKGWQESVGEIVVFTDDDVVVDLDWVGRLVSGFSINSNVGCVTGAIIPAELETPSQDWLEQFGGFNKGFDRQIFDLEENRRPEPLYPFDAGRFGSGANIALKRETLDTLNGFAIDLGAGTVAWGGEDLDILRRTISAGFGIVYEPGALMWHRHRRGYDALRKQMYRYGVGLSATATKWFMESPALALQVLRLLPLGAKHVLAPKSKKNKAKSPDYPKVLSYLELAGMVSGPFAYIRSRKRVRSVDTRS